MADTLPDPHCHADLRDGVLSRSFARGAEAGAEVVMRQYQSSKVPNKRKDPKDGSGIHPIIRWIWVEMNRQCASQEDVAKRAGVSSSAMRKWRKGDRSPKLFEIEAVVNALGGTLRVRGDSVE